MFKKVAFTMYPIQDATRARAFYEKWNVTLGCRVRQQPSLVTCYCVGKLPAGKLQGSRACAIVQRGMSSVSLLLWDYWPRKLRRGSVADGYQQNWV